MQDFTEWKVQVGYSLIQGRFCTAQKMLFSTENFFRKCDQICSFQRKSFLIKLWALCLQLYENKILHRYFSNVLTGSAKELHLLNNFCSTPSFAE